MQVIAQLKNLRISPRKVRLVSGLLKGRDALTAKYQLDNLAKKSSSPISKLLDSALANAHNNFGLAKSNLFIKEILVNEGPKLKRFRPKGFGSTSPIEKKTSSIRIVLEERVPGLKATTPTPMGRGSEADANSRLSDRSVGSRSVGENKKEREIAEETVMTEKKIQTAPKVKPEIKKEIGKKGVFGKISKKIFQRKVV